MFAVIIMSILLQLDPLYAYPMPKSATTTELDSLKAALSHLTKTIDSLKLRKKKEIKTDGKARVHRAVGTAAVSIDK